jgi:hypothetical protein
LPCNANKSQQKKVVATESSDEKLREMFVKSKLAI